MHLVFNCIGAISNDEKVYRFNKNQQSIKIWTEEARINPWCFNGGVKKSLQYDVKLNIQA